MAEKSLYSGGKPVAPEEMLFFYLSNGATHQVLGNYSDAGTGAEEFKVTCKTGSQRLHINRMIVYVEDVGTFPSDKYGYNLALTNGIHVAVQNASDVEIKDLDGNQNVKTNAQWSRLCYDVAYQPYGSGNDSLSVRWTFGNSGKKVSLSSGQSLVVTANDDFSGLVEHTFMVQGYYA